MPTSIGQPNRIFLILVCLLLPLLGSAANLHAQDQPAQPTEKLTPRQIIELSEIAALQARLGGGATKELKGVVPGADPEQQFLNSLRSLVQEQKSTEPKLIPPQELPNMSAGMIAEARATSTPWRAQMRPSFSANADPSQQVLRSSARTLEGLAAELEQAQLYDQADELRKMAAQYWLQARSMD